jgi:L-seryl-tRNA(Ser) seleniumtransferase
VRPLINARGTFTIISGSLMLPEVRAAMDAASRYHVHLDELMGAIGSRLAELTKAEWGMVSSGCAAAISHATAACVAGGNPDLHVRLPDLTGFVKTEVIIPTHSRNVYDAAVRAVGVTIVEVDTPEQLALAIGPKTAMIYFFTTPRNETGPMSLENIARIAKPHGVPIMVDAAAEILTVPNVHLQRGATLVGYSGGKILRGPQTAGLLLGRKDLVQAAWMHSAPHHGYARAMKVGREEVVAMLVAVDRWVKGDRAAEWAGWVRQAEVIAAAAGRVPGVTVTAAAAPPAGDVGGQWRVEIAYVASRSTHVLQLRQRGAVIEGSHQGDLVTRDLSGTMDGAKVTFTSRITERTGSALNYRFTGELSGDTMAGTIDMGEYRSATFTAGRVGNA